MSSSQSNLTISFSDSSKVGVKISKAALLQKGGDYLKELKVNIENGQQEIESCSEEIANLTAQLELLHNR